MWPGFHGSTPKRKTSPPPPPVMVSGPCAPTSVSLPAPPARFEPPSWAVSTWPPPAGGGETGGGGGGGGETGGGETGGGGDTGGGGGGGGGTDTVNVSVAFAPSESITIRVIVAVPDWPAAGVIATVRFAPLPPSWIAASGISAGFDD